MYIANSLCYILKTNTTFKINYTTIYSKNNKKKVWKIKLKKKNNQSSKARKSLGCLSAGFKF